MTKYKLQPINNHAKVMISVVNVNKTKMLKNDKQPMR